MQESYHKGEGEAETQKKSEIEDQEDAEVGKEAEERQEKGDGAAKRGAERVGGGGRERNVLAEKVANPVQTSVSTPLSRQPEGLPSTCRSENPSKPTAPQMSDSGNFSRSTFSRPLLPWLSLSCPRASRSEPPSLPQPPGGQLIC